MAIDADIKSRPQNGQRAIVEHFRQAIRSGEIAPGAMLPTQLEIASEFDVWNTTACRAMSQLVKEGLVVRSRGKGTVVAENRRMSRVALYQPRHELVSGGLHLPLYAMLEEELTRRGVATVLVQETLDGFGMKLLAELAKKKDIHGLVVNAPSPEKMAQFRKLPVPFTCLTLGADRQRRASSSIQSLIDRDRRGSWPARRPPPGGALAVSSGHGSWRQSARRSRRKFAERLWRAVAAAGVELVHDSRCPLHPVETPVQSKHERDQHAYQWAEHYLAMAGAPGGFAGAVRGHGSRAH